MFRICGTSSIIGKLPGRTKGLFWGPVVKIAAGRVAGNSNLRLGEPPGRGETPRSLVWVKLGTALAPSVISLRSTIEVRSPASLEAARPSPDRPLT